MNRAASSALFVDHTMHLHGDLLELRQWTVFSRTFPVLDLGFERAGRQPFRVRFGCDDWNEIPPSITLLSFGGDVLTKVPTGPAGVFHQGPHASTGRPFVCMAGSREYHTHESHTADLWDNYKARAGYDLGGIATQIWNGWLRSTP